MLYLSAVEGPPLTAAAAVCSYRPRHRPTFLLRGVREQFFFLAVEQQQQMTADDTASSAASTIAAQQHRVERRARD